MTMRAMSHASPRPARSSILLAAALLAFVGFAVGPVAHPAPTNAATADYMEGLLVKWINHARQNRGIAPLKVGWRLEDLAGDRAATMASTGRMEHTSCLSCALNSHGVSYDRCGEVIAYTTYPWGYDAARSIFRGWKGSSAHWGILMSSRYHRIGIGVAYRSSAHATFAAGILVG